MARADTNSTRLAWVAETVEGETNSTPSFQNLRYTGESLNYNVETVNSNEIGRRDITDQIKIGEMASGNIQGELSYGTYEFLFESLLGGTFASNVLKNGTYRHSFTFEETFETGSPDMFHRYIGVMANSMALDISKKSVATVDFGLMGRSASVAEAAIAGATYANANDKPVLNASDDIQAITLGSLNECIESLSMSVAANLREQQCIGSASLSGIGLGGFEVTGSLTAYFQSNDLLNATVNQTKLPLSITIGRDENEKYKIVLPAIKLSSPKIEATGRNGDVMAQFNYTAIFDASEACTMKITRAVA